MSPVNKECRLGSSRSVGQSKHLLEETKLHGVLFPPNGRKQKNETKRNSDQLQKTALKIKYFSIEVLFVSNNTSCRFTAVLYLSQKSSMCATSHNYCLFPRFLLLYSMVCGYKSLSQVSECVLELAGVWIYCSNIIRVSFLNGEKGRTNQSLYGSLHVPEEYSRTALHLIKNKVFSPQ